MKQTHVGVRMMTFELQFCSNSLENSCKLCREVWQRFAADKHSYHIQTTWQHTIHLQRIVQTHTNTHLPTYL